MRPLARRSVALPLIATLVAPGCGDDGDDPDAVGDAPVESAPTGDDDDTAADTETTTTVEALPDDEASADDADEVAADDEIPEGPAHDSVEPITAFCDSSVTRNRIDPLRIPRYAAFPTGTAPSADASRALRRAHS